MQYRDLIYRIHARQSMFMRSISDEDQEEKAVKNPRFESGGVQGGLLHRKS